MKITVKNAIFDELYITQDIAYDITDTLPLAWDNDNSIIIAKFQNNLIGGDIDEAIIDVLDNLASVRIKKRKTGSLDAYNWLTIAEKSIDNIDKIDFYIEDITCANDTEYEYAWVPVLKNGTEGEYITKSIISKFKGTILGDSNIRYAFDADVEYGSISHNQRVGVFEPYGRKYPIYVSNAETNYENGSLTARIIGSYLTTNKWDYRELVENKQSVMKFLTNRHAKVLKDTYGNIWLIMVVDNPAVLYDNGTGNSMMKVSFNWSEIGDVNDNKDLTNSGLVGGNT